MTYQSLEEVLFSLKELLHEMQDKIPSVGIKLAEQSMPVALASDGPTNEKLAFIQDCLEIIKECFARGITVANIDEINFSIPAVQDSRITNFPQIQTVSVNNFPAYPVAQYISNFQDIKFPETQKVSITNPVTSTSINNFPETQRVNVANFPAGLATNLELIALREKLPSTLLGDRLKVDGSGVTQPISTRELPLPNNAATETTLKTLSEILAQSLATQKSVSEGLEVTGSSSLLNPTIISPIDTSKYNTAILQILASGMIVGAFVVEGSNDNTTWHSLAFEDTTAKDASTRITSASAAGLYYLPRLAKFIRVKLSSVNSVVVTGRMLLRN